MRRNLTTQGYRLCDEDSRALAVGLRFSTGLCLTLVGAPALAPNPARRRDAFKVATLWLLVVGGLIATGTTTAGLVLAGMLVAARAIVTATNLCLPSEKLAWAHHAARNQRVTT